MPLSDADKERLTGQVIAVLEKRDAAQGLKGWLLHVPDRHAPATTPDEQGQPA
jgi:hypothetical protein